ncbi:divergent PAP2 family protein [Candidatus Omnitrophota bacterium]
MKEIFILFSKNSIFWTAISAWVIAQALKLVIGVFREKKFNFRWFIGTGGFPSSHAAGVACLATCVGITYGTNSPIFAITLIFSLIVLFDAQGVRRAAGRQAEILNRMLDDIYWKKKMDERRLFELIGHTPIQVLSGVALGIVIALWLFRK